MSEAPANIGFRDEIICSLKKKWSAMIVKTGIFYTLVLAGFMQMIFKSYEFIKNFPPEFSGKMYVKNTISDTFLWLF